MSSFLKTKALLKIEELTSPERIISDEDISLYLEVSDKIRSREYHWKDAVNAFIKRIEDKNPRTQLLALKLLDFCAKNSGNDFLECVLSAELVDVLLKLFRITNNKEVRGEILHFVVLWGTSSLENNVTSHIASAYNDLLKENVVFPVISSAESESIKYHTEQAPKWRNSQVCSLCHTEFTVINRIHHCRACGLPFCGSCSSKSIEIPKFGFTKPVRVCDTCYELLCIRIDDDKISPRRLDSNSDFDSQIRLAIDLSHDDARATLPPEKHVTFFEPTASFSEPLQSSSPTTAEFSQSDLDSIYELSIILPKLKSAIQHDPDTSLQFDGALNLLDKMNHIRLILIKKMASCNSEVRRIELELNEIDALEHIWAKIAEKEVKFLSNSYLSTITTAAPNNFPHMSQIPLDHLASSSQSHPLVSPDHPHITPTIPPDYPQITPSTPSDYPQITPSTPSDYPNLTPLISPDHLASPHPVSSNHPNLIPLISPDHPASSSQSHSPVPPEYPNLTPLISPDHPASSSQPHSPVQLIIDIDSPLNFSHDFSSVDSEKTHDTTPENNYTILENNDTGRKTNYAE